jgi:hypothetical protein
MFWLGKFATTLRIAEGFREPTPFFPVLTLHFVLKLSQVPYEPLVSPPLYVPPLSGLCCPWHPQPWSLKKCVGDFGLAAFLRFAYLSRTECPYPTQKV